MENATRTEANADVKGGNQIKRIKSLVINSKIFYDALKNINTETTKADIEKKIIKHTTNSMQDSTHGNDEINKYIDSPKFSECKNNSEFTEKANKEEVNWKDLYKSIVEFDYEYNSAKIAEIDKNKTITYILGGLNKSNKTIELLKTGFSKTISIVLAKNAMIEYDVDKQQQKKTTENYFIDKEILDIAKNGNDEKSLEEYQKELIETFLIELRKYKEDSDIQTIQDVLTIVCKEISATNEDLVIELNDKSEKPKEEVYYYFYKQKLEELNEAKKKLEETFKKRDDFFENKEENKESILDLDSDINEEINEINNIRKAFEEGYGKYHGSENGEDCRNFKKIYKEINENIKKEREKVLKINGFTKLGVGFINGKTIEYKEKIEEFEGLDEIEKFKTKVEYCVLGAIAYIDNNKEKHIDSDSKENCDLLEELLGLIADKDNDDDKWIQKDNMTKDKIENEIKNWKPEALENKPVFAALTYYNEKGPVVNFVSKGELRPAYSYNEFDGKKYMIFMIPEKGNDNVVKPKYYVFKEGNLVTEKIPFTITHDIVNCDKAIAYDGNEKMEFIEKKFETNIKDANIVNEADYLSGLLEAKYITNKETNTLNEYREAVQNDALFINEIKEKNGKEIENDKEYVESDPEKDEAESKKGSVILKRRGGMLGAGEGISL